MNIGRCFTISNMFQYHWVSSPVCLSSNVMTCETLTSTILFISCESPFDVFRSCVTSMKDQAHVLAVLCSYSHEPCCYPWFVCHDNSQHNVLLGQVRPMMVNHLPSTLLILFCIRDCLTLRKLLLRLKSLL